MSSMAEVEQLDKAIDDLVVRPYGWRLDGDGEVDEEGRELAELASELRLLPRAEFRAQLADELEHHAQAIRKRETWLSPPVSRSYRVIRGNREDRDFPVLPTLSGQLNAGYPVQRVNFAASFLLHAAAIALVALSGAWVVRHHQEGTKLLATTLVERGAYTPPVTTGRAGGGGGGGGDRDKVEASKGSPPRFASEQITPPMVVLRNDNAKLTVEATVVGPPDVKLPQSSQLGDPLSAVLAAPSNGTGSGGGIGSGEGGGVGPGRGPGVGPGWGGGIGGGPYRVGGGVSAPRVLYSPDPEYSEEARKAKYQGTVVLWVVVGADGRPKDVQISRSLGMGLDEKAVEAVRSWKFEPARKDGQPVAVQINIEVSFRLY